MNKKIKILMGIGDWGLGIGDWAQSPIPNPQIPNPQSPIPIYNKFMLIILMGFLSKKIIFIYLSLLNGGS
jgi:hypothetical protein